MARSEEVSLRTKAAGGLRFGLGIVGDCWKGVLGSASCRMCGERA